MMRREQLEALAEAVQGIAVLGCMPGSTAAEAGVRYGDILLEVNGQRTVTIDDYLTGRKLRTDGIALRLFREGQELSLFVELRPVPPEARWETLLEMLGESPFNGALTRASSEPKPRPS